MEPSAAALSAAAGADGDGDASLGLHDEVVSAGDTRVDGVGLEPGGRSGDVAEAGEVEHDEAVASRAVAGEEGVVAERLDVPGATGVGGHDPQVHRVRWVGDVEDRHAVGDADQGVLAARVGVGPAPRVADAVPVLAAQGGNGEEGEEIHVVALEACGVAVDAGALAPGDALEGLSAPDPAREAPAGGGPFEDGHAAGPGVAQRGAHGRGGVPERDGGAERGPGRVPGEDSRMPPRALRPLPSEAVHLAAPVLGARRTDPERIAVHGQRGAEPVPAGGVRSRPDRVGQPPGAGLIGHQRVDGPDPRGARHDPLLAEGQRRAEGSPRLVGLQHRDLPPPGGAVLEEEQPAAGALVGDPHHQEVVPDRQGRSTAEAPSLPRLEHGLRLPPAPGGPQHADPIAPLGPDGEPGAARVEGHEPLGRAHDPHEPGHRHSAAGRARPGILDQGDAGVHAPPVVATDVSAGRAPALGVGRSRHDHVFGHCQRGAEPFVGRDGRGRGEGRRPPPAVGSPAVDEEGRVPALGRGSQDDEVRGVAAGDRGQRDGLADLGGGGGSWQGQERGEQDRYGRASTESAHGILRVG